MKYITLISLNCGREDKKIDVSMMKDEQIERLISELKYDKQKFILIKS